MDENVSMTLHLFLQRWSLPELHKENTRVTLSDSPWCSQHEELNHSSAAYQNWQEFFQSEEAI